MSDIFREVDEELQRKQMKRLWDRYGYLVIGAALLIVLVTAGYKGWEAYRDSVQAERGDRFLAALRLSDEGKYEEARAAFEDLATSSGAGYKALARFRAASDKAAAGDAAGAIADFDALSRDGSLDPFLQDIARVRAGYLAIDEEDFDTVSARVADLDTDDNPLRFSAREIIGLAAWKADRFDLSRQRYEALRADAETPSALRQRAEFMLALLKSRMAAEAAAATPPATQTQ